MTQKNFITKYLIFYAASHNIGTSWVADFVRIKAMANDILYTAIMHYTVLGVYIKDMKV